MTDERADMILQNTIDREEKISFCQDLSVVHPFHFTRMRIFHNEVRKERPLRRVSKDRDSDRLALITNFWAEAEVISYDQIE